MEKDTKTPIFQLSLTQRIAFSFTIPVITTLIIVMFAFVGFKHIQSQTQVVYQKIVQPEAEQQQTEILEMLKKLEKRIEFIKKQLVMVSLISLILTIMICALIIRTVQMQYRTRMPEQDGRLDE